MGPPKFVGNHRTNDEHHQFGHPLELPVGPPKFVGEDPQVASLLRAGVMESIIKNILSSFENPTGPGNNARVITI